MNALKKNAITFGITFCISVLIFGIIAYIIMSMLFGTSIFGNSSEEAQDKDLLVGFEEPVDTPTSNGKTFSFILVGYDYQPKVLPDAKVSADAIIYVRFSNSTKKVVYMSIPSITTVKVNNKDIILADIYSEYGLETMADEVAELTGLDVNYYAAVSLSYFDDVMDTLGGIEYNVPIDMEYEDPDQKLAIELEKGKQHLSGHDASDMLRYRSDSLSACIDRQTEFFKTLMETFTQESYKEGAKDLFAELTYYIRTDFEEEDLLNYLDTIYNYSSFESKILTFPGTYRERDNDVFFVADTEEASRMLNEYKY